MEEPIQPRGYNESIARMRAAWSAKKAAEMRMQEMGKSQDFLQRNEPKSSSSSPFTSTPSSPPALCVNVKISSQKTAAIEIRNGDVPATLCAEFCALHGLSEEKRATLEELVVHACSSHGVILGSLMN